ncbi:retrovirus-related pol polyprotein from transposon TNT 1-94 [Tanacetum coccineum]
MVPRTILSRSGPISVNTVRPVITIQPRTTVNNAGPMKNVINNAYSIARRPFNKITAANNSNFTKKVNTVKGTRVNTARPKAVLSAVKGNKGNAVKASACWVWRPKHKILDHVSRNNGASMSFKRFDYIDAQGRSKSDYEEIDGGFVAFGGNSKGGKITGKGKIRTGKLDFEDVYFVKELKFNLFSVLQMCDKKNIPRKDNMYNVDLKNVVPQGGTKWVYKNKKDERGIVIKNKVRLVAQGYTQEERIDYDEMDVKSAFLYDKIEEEVYVCQPPGFEDPDFPDRVYKVEKALYGLHQAPRACSMGELTFFLGLQVKQKEDRIFISQDKYVTEILKKFGFSDVKTASTPMETHKPLLKDANGKDVDEHLYRSMIGSLMYLTSSRPDIMFADLPFDLVAFTDSDYAGASLDRKPTTGVKNLVFHLKTKHIEIRHHFIRDSNEKKLIQMIKIHTDHNVTDLLTKAFERILHKGWLKWNVPDARDEIEVKTSNSRVNAIGHYLVLLGENNVDFAEIVDFLNVNRISSKSTAWNEFDTNIASTVICLAKNQKFNFSKLIFDEVNAVYDTPSHTKKIFANMRRQGKDFSGTVIPLFSSMLAQQEDMDETVTKEREDIMEMAATTASSLEAKQDNGAKIPYWVMQKLKTRFETASKQSNDPPLSRVNTLGSREDRLKLKELMDLFTKLSDRGRNLKQGKQSSIFEESDFDDEGFDADMDEVFKDVKGVAEQVISAAANEVPTGDAVNTAGTEVNTASAPVTTAGVSVSTAKPITTASVNITTVEPITPPRTITTIFKDEDLIIAQTLVKMRSENYNNP